MKNTFKKKSEFYFQLLRNGVKENIVMISKSEEMQRKKRK